MSVQLDPSCFVLGITVLVVILNEVKDLLLPSQEAWVEDLTLVRVQLHLANMLRRTLQQQHQWQHTK